MFISKRREPDMRKCFLICLLIAVMSGCLVSCTKRNMVSDDFLQLELILSDTEYAVGEPIECKAILTYIGKGDSFTFYPNDPIVKIVIGGGEYFNGEADLVSKDIILPTVTIYKDQPMEFPFVKYGGSYLGTDEKAAVFWEEFLAEEELLLEKGEYEMIAYCLYNTELPGKWETLMVREKIIVQ